SPPIGRGLTAAPAHARPRARGSTAPGHRLFIRFAARRFLAFNDTAEDLLKGRELSAADLTGIEAALSAVRPQGMTAMYDAVAAGLDRIAEAGRPRKILIVVSDGGDNASRATLKGGLERAR